jgi:hypothetical protein
MCAQRDRSFIPPNKKPSRKKGLDIWWVRNNYFHMICLFAPGRLVAWSLGRLVAWSLLAMSGVGSVMGAELPNPGMQISRGAEVGDWQLGWHGVKGWTYFLQQSPNILEWSYLPWIASGDDGPLGLTVRSSAGAGFLSLARH